jgi:hypothetical protein
MGWALAAELYNNLDFLIMKFSINKIIIIIIITLNRSLPRPLMNKSREVRESRAFGELWNTDVRTTSEQFYFDELCEYLTLRCFAAVYSFPQSSPHCIPLNSSILPDSVWPYSRIQFGHGA